MRLSEKTKKVAFFMLSFIIVVPIILFFISSLFQRTEKQIPAPPKPAFPTPIESLRSNIRVERIIPDKNVTLQPGQKQSFLVEFASPITNTSVQVGIFQKNITRDEGAKLISSESSLGNGGRTLTATLNSSVLPLSQYDFLIVDKSNNALVFKTSFLSAEEQPSPIQANNKALIPFLPHETPSYRLSYLESRNVYVFNFKYNPDSPDNLLTQYEQAKQDAASFIQSKGIDMSTIVIEWRNY